MRLRFDRLSLPVLIILAALIGVIFYIIDNNRGTPDHAQTVATPIGTRAVAASTPELEIATSATPATRFVTSARQEIPVDTSIFIPTAGIWSDVIQAYLDGNNWDISNLRSNAGHLEGTPWVSQPGNVVISGHVELANGLPGIFAELDRIDIGDVITVQSGGIEYTYIVTETYLTVPTDLQPLMPTPRDRLTLITCDSYDIVSNAYQERLIVVAERVS